MQWLQKGGCTEMGQLCTNAGSLRCPLLSQWATRRFHCEAPDVHKQLTLPPWRTVIVFVRMSFQTQSQQPFQIQENFIIEGKLSDSLRQSLREGEETLRRTTAGQQCLPGAASVHRLHCVTHAPQGNGPSGTLTGRQDERKRLFRRRLVLQ